MECITKYIKFKITPYLLKQKKELDIKGNISVFYNKVYNIRNKTPKKWSALIGRTYRLYY